MRLFFINRFYAPDFSATAQMLTDVAEGLAARGRDVRVITSRLMYEDPGRRLPPREVIAGVQVIRVGTTRFGRAGLAGRAIDYLTFYISCAFCILHHVRRGDIIVTKTDPPLLAVVANAAARLKGAKAVNWLQDIFPEVASRLGLRVAGPPVSTLLVWLRNRTLRSAARTVVIGARMHEYVEGLGAPPDRIVDIPNFCDDAAIRPCPAEANPLRRAWNFDPGHFVIGYSGNLGRAHDLDTLLGAADALRDMPDIKFLFIGGNSLRSRVERAASELNLTSVMCQPYQPREALAESLSVPDVHWVSLRPELEGLIVPSKIYGIAAAGRPVLMIGHPDGDIGRLLSRHGFGCTVAIGAAETLAARILSWRNNREEVQRLGERARRFIDDHARRDLAVGKWDALVSELSV